MLIISNIINCMFTFFRSTINKIFQSTKKFAKSIIDTGNPANSKLVADKCESRVRPTSSRLTLTFKLSGNTRPTINPIFLLFCLAAATEFVNLINVLS